MHVDARTLTQQYYYNGAETCIVSMMLKTSKIHAYLLIAMGIIMLGLRRSLCMTFAISDVLIICIIIISMVLVTFAVPLRVSML